MIVHRPSWVGDGAQDLIRWRLAACAPAKVESQVFCRHHCRAFHRPVDAGDRSRPLVVVRRRDGRVLLLALLEERTEFRVPGRLAKPGQRLGQPLAQPDRVGEVKHSPCFSPRTDGMSDLARAWRTHPGL